MPVLVILSLFSFTLTSAAAGRIQSMMFFFIGAMAAIPLAAWSLWISGWSLTATI